MSPRDSSKENEVTEGPEVGPESPAADGADGVRGERAIDRVVAFHLAGQLYGLPIDVVREIQQLAELLPLPDDDPALVGLVEIRGVVVPVLDLRALVGLEHMAYTLETPMVFCRAGMHDVCLIVDSVDDVVDLPPGGIQVASAVYALADRMLGTVKLDRGVLMLLDIERLVPAAALAAADTTEVAGR